MARKRKSQPEQQTETVTVEQPVEPPVTAPVEPPVEQTHAEKVKRKAGYIGQGGSDYQIGVFRDEYQDSAKKEFVSVIRFKERPSNAVTEYMNASGFEFQPLKKEWAQSLAYDSRQAGRLHADRVYKKVCDMIREELGLSQGQGVA